MDKGVAVAIRFSPRRGRKTLPDAMQDVEDVFAGAQRVGTEIGARTVRLPSLFAAQRHAIRLARKRAGDRVIGPGPRRVGRDEAELLGPRPFLAVAEGLFEQFLLIQQLQRPPLVWRGGQAEERLLFQHQRNRRADVLADRRADGTVKMEPVLGLGHGGNGHHGVLSVIAYSPQLQSKQVAAKVDVAVDVDVVVSGPSTDQLGAAGPQELAGPIVSQA